MHSNPILTAPLHSPHSAEAIYWESVRPKLAPAQEEVNRRQVVREESGFVDNVIGIPELEVEKRKYRRQRQRKVQSQQLLLQAPIPVQQRHHLQHQPPPQQVSHSQIADKERTTIRLAHRSVALQRHLNKDKIKEREKEKERNKAKDKEKVMAEQHANDQERRIHELDQNVVRFFEIRKVSVDCCYLSNLNYRLIDSLIDPTPLPLQYQIDISAWARVLTALYGRQRISEKRTQLLSRKSTMLFAMKPMHSVPTAR